MKDIANLHHRYPGFFHKMSKGQRDRIEKDVGFIRGACHSCNMVKNGLACERMFQETSKGSGDCWHPPGTLLVRGEVAEWARE